MCSVYSVRFRLLTLLSSTFGCFFLLLFCTHIHQHRVKVNIFTVKRYESTMKSRKRNGKRNENEKKKKYRIKNVNKIKQPEQCCCFVSCFCCCCSCCCCCFFPLLFLFWFIHSHCVWMLFFLSVLYLFSWLWKFVGKLMNFLAFSLCVYYWFM